MEWPLFDYLADETGIGLSVDQTQTARFSTLHRFEIVQNIFLCSVIHVLSTPRVSNFNDKCDMVIIIEAPILFFTLMSA